MVVLQKEYIQWQDIKKIKGVKERHVTWKTFKKHFKRNYLSKQYYEEKDKEFYELRLGAITMKELCIKFLSLLHYVPSIIDKKKYNVFLVVYLLYSENRVR